MENKIKFVSYTGEYPNLCSGTLIIEHCGKQYSMNLRSGGSVHFDKGGEEYVSRGEWSIRNYPEDFPENLKKEAVRIVNENVPYGCCGGCI